MDIDKYTDFRSGDKFNLNIVQKDFLAKEPDSPNIQVWVCMGIMDERFPFTKNSGLKFRKLHVLIGTVHSDPSHRAFCIVASQQTQNYTLKEKSKYWLYPTEHSTVEKGQWKTKGGGILFRVENLWMQVEVKNSRELKRYVSQNIWTIRSNSWNCTVNKFDVLARFVFSQAMFYSFQLNW